MDKSYYDKDFESVLKDFEKNSPLKKGEAIEGKSYFKSAGQFPKPSNLVTKPSNLAKELATPDTFLKRRIKLSGPIGAAATVGALAGVALEKGISKLKSKKGEDAKSEIPSGEEVQGKAKGGYVKKPYRMHSGKF